MNAPGFRALAGARRCPGPGELLLALAAEFTRSDPAEGAARLDDGARRLFGIVDLEPDEQAERLAVVLDRDLGLGLAKDYEPETVLLDRVLETLRGHPLLLAVVGRELAVRAGAEARVFVSPTRWFVGLTAGSQTVMLDARLVPVGERPPPSVRGLCAHEIAFCVLSGLERRFIARDRLFEARMAARLRDVLPDLPDGQSGGSSRRAGHWGRDGDHRA